MGMHGNGMATGALAARALGGGPGTFTQPGAHQGQAQLPLPQPGRALQQPGMATLAQQSALLAGPTRGAVMRCCWRLSRALLQSAPALHGGQHLLPNGGARGIGLNAGKARRIFRAAAGIAPATAAKMGLAVLQTDRAGGRWPGAGPPPQRAGQTTALSLVCEQNQGLS